MAKEDFKYSFNNKLLSDMFIAIESVYPKFDQKEFFKLKQEIKTLEMKDRVKAITNKLYELLPDSYPKSLSILLRASKKHNLEGHILWPFTHYIYLYGMNDFEQSLNAMKELTSFFTCEWAVRSFIIKDHKAVIKYLLKETKNPNHHVRRWASEGLRPRIPWGEVLNIFVEKPKLTLPVLEKLVFDESLYVRRSVANHLNDITKDHPKIVLEFLENAKKKIKNKENEERLSWIIKHSLRTLIKKGDPETLKFLGFSQKFKTEFSTLKLSKKKVKIGESFDFSFRAENKSSEEKLIVDYILYFMKKNGSQTPKVFKLKNITIPKNGVIEIKKSHSFKLITTRVYYPGLHKLAIQVNGCKVLEETFEVTKSS